MRVNTLLFTLATATVTAALPAFSFPNSTIAAPSNTTTTTPSTVIHESDCATGLNIMVARGSTEAEGPGMIGEVADSIVEKVPGSRISSLKYAAELNPLKYRVSEANGTDEMNVMIRDYGDRCPGSKMVLMGYSQGAHVVGDVMCGRKDLLGLEPSAPLEERYSKDIVAIIQMGDPAHVKNFVGNVGTASGKTGLFSRSDAEDCIPALEGRTQSYCDKGDTFCAHGLRSSVHGSYVKKYKEAATQFVVDLASKQ